MQRNSAERRHEPRRREERNATTTPGEQPQAAVEDETTVQNDVPSFFRTGEFAARDPSLPERRSGAEQRRVSRKNVMNDSEPD